jgi:hypothetical protein
MAQVYVVAAIEHGADEDDMFEDNTTFINYSLGSHVYTSLDDAKQRARKIIRDHANQQHSTHLNIEKLENCFTNSMTIVYKEMTVNIHALEVKQGDTK